MSPLACAKGRPGDYVAPGALIQVAYEICGPVADQEPSPLGLNCGGGPRGRRGIKRPHGVTKTLSLHFLYCRCIMTGYYQLVKLFLYHRYNRYLLPGVAQRPGH